MYYFDSVFPPADLKKGVWMKLNYQANN